MAIKVSGTTVINDSRNLSSVGIATVGSGSSAITLNGNTGIVTVGSGITINANNGNINISGILTVGQFVVPIQVSSFNPAIGSTGNSVSTDIIIDFNQTVGLGTTGFIEIRVGSATTQTIFVSAASTILSLSNGGRRLTINPSRDFPNATNTITTIMSNGFVVANGNNFTGINTVGTAQTYSFSTKALALGDSFGGGNLICQAGGVRWVAAPSSTEIVTSWYCRADSNTCAQTVTGCSGWFVPSCPQMQNPGNTCATYWAPSPSTFYYWTDTQFNTVCGVAVYIVGGFYTVADKTFGRRVRSFRCVTY